MVLPKDSKILIEHKQEINYIIRYLGQKYKSKSVNYFLTLAIHIVHTKLKDKSICSHH